jgi:histidyl-tRNA synthetase
VQDALREAPAIGDALCDECREHFARVRDHLDVYDVAYELVPTLVRGLDYYTRTTFEFVGPAEGAQSTICGGGRYDGLIEEIGGPPTPALGFGAGIERLLIALEDAGVTADPPRIDVFFVLEQGVPRRLVARWLAELRKAGVSADVDYAGRSLKGQLTQAARAGAETTIVVGPERASLRRAGRPDEPIEHDEIVGRLSR